MAENGTYIRDIQSLEQLNNMIEYSGEAMANIEENVSGYINGVRDVLEKQLEVLQERLEQAEERLQAAEEDLSACEASQEYDEDSNEYQPSCRCEEAAVAAARKEVENCRRNYEAGERILSECKNEIDDYNEPGGMLTPPGGHCLIKNMREYQAPKASEQLRELISKLQDISNTDVSGGQDNSYDNWKPSKEDKPLTQNKRLEIFQKNVQQIKEEQVSSRLKDANRAMHCPICLRPIPLCICRNLHGDVHIYK